MKTIKPTNGYAPLFRLYEGHVLLIELSRRKAAERHRTSNIRFTKPTLLPIEVRRRESGASRIRTDNFLLAGEMPCQIGLWPRYKPFVLFDIVIYDNVWRYYFSSVLQLN